MPLYEYQCSACSHRLETIQRHTDAPLQECPECGKAQLQKLISAAGFRLSGKGWYETDFKNDKQRNLSQKDSAEEKKPPKSDESGTEKKSSDAGDTGGAKKIKPTSAEKSKTTNAPLAAGN
jgi:putative FmdB family regulatory protein